MFWDGLDFGFRARRMRLEGLVVYMLIAILPGEKVPQGQNKIYTVLEIKKTRQNKRAKKNT